MLLTRELRTALRHNANLSEITERDHKPVVKLFTPDSSATWLLSELVADEDTLFVLCDPGHGTPELGYASLSEISVLRGPMRLLWSSAIGTSSQTSPCRNTRLMPAQRVGSSLRRSHPITLKYARTSTGYSSIESQYNRVRRTGNQRCSPRSASYCILNQRKLYVVATNCFQ